MASTDSRRLTIGITCASAALALGFFGVLGLSVSKDAPAIFSSGILPKSTPPLNSPPPPAGEHTLPPVRKGKGPRKGKGGKAGGSGGLIKSNFKPIGVDRTIDPMKQVQLGGLKELQMNRLKQTHPHKGVHLRKASGATKHRRDAMDATAGTVSGSMTTSVTSAPPAKLDGQIMVARAAARAAARAGQRPFGATKHRRSTTGDGTSGSGALADLKLRAAKARAARTRAIGKRQGKAGEDAGNAGGHPEAQPGGK
jgi:hypothetical protein